MAAFPCRIASDGVPGGPAQGLMSTEGELAIIPIVMILLPGVLQSRNKESTPAVRNSLTRVTQKITQKELEE